jgi:hypothetical protein
VTPAAGGIRFTAPTTPSVAQSKAGDASHQVELWRVCEAQTDRAEDDVLGADEDVVLVEDLGDRVVSADVQRDVVDPDRFGVDELVARS